MVHRGSAEARISSLGEVEEEEDGPSSRGNKAAIAEVPERHTGHAGRASITLHCTVKERERDRGERQGGDRGETGLPGVCVGPCGLVCGPVPSSDTKLTTCWVPGRFGFLSVLMFWFWRFWTLDSGCLFLGPGSHEPVNHPLK